MNTIDTPNIPDKGLPLRAGLWLAQVMLAGVYLPTAIAVLFLPAAKLLVAVPWADHVPGGVLEFIGTIDLAAGLGILLPSLTRVAPRLTVLAGVCSAMFQVFVVFSHALLGAPATTPAVSLAVLALSMFVVWGRSNKEPIAPRRQNRHAMVIDIFTSDQTEKPTRRYRRCDLKTRTSMASACTLDRRSPRRWAAVTNRRSFVSRTLPERTGNRASE